MMMKKKYRLIQSSVIYLLIVKCMSVSIYLISLTDEDDDNEMFVLKYIHLITNKSFEIRNEVIKSIELIIKNNNNDYFKDIYENLTKLIKFYNSSSSETDTDSDDLNNRYKIIRKDRIISDNQLNRLDNFIANFKRLISYQMNIL